LSIFTSATHAAGGRDGETLGERLEQLAALQEPAAVLGARSRGDRTLDDARLLTGSRRHHQPYAGLCVVLPERERHFDRQHAAIGEQRVCTQWMVAPAALQTSGERAAQRRMRRFVEQVHDRLPGETLLDAEQLAPRRVGLDDDPFLHLEDGVIRALQDRVELAACVVRRPHAGIERALDVKHAQFPQHHRREARRTGERHDIAGPECETGCDPRLIHLRSELEQRDGGGELIADAYHRFELLGRAGDVHQQLRVDLGERVPEIAQRRDPGAVRRLTRAPQQAVDRLDRVACGAQHDERNGVRLVQESLPGALARAADSSTALWGARVRRLAEWALTLPATAAAAAAPLAGVGGCRYHTRPF